jgi:hypothetical protein
MSDGVTERARRICQHFQPGLALTPNCVNGVEATGRPDLIPSLDESFPLLQSRWAYDIVQWMIQKDSLQQDMFLIGSHSPLRRHLALRFCEVTKKEVEYVALTGDTTEADLKQRREIVAGGTVKWTDQGVVRAALMGRVLVLEGLEKAERNVLPVLNNLLENREMQLEDGRFLCSAARYDKLLAEGGKPPQDLLRVHPGFRVIA